MISRGERAMGVRDGFLTRLKIISLRARVSQSIEFAAARNCKLSPKKVRKAPEEHFSLFSVANDSDFIYKLKTSRKT